MADPISWLVIGAKALGGAAKAGAAKATSSSGLASLSSAASVASTVMSGLGASQRSKFDAEVARSNARLAILQGNEDAMATRRQAVIDFSRAKAMAAGSGVQFSGSVLDVAAQNAAMAELEARQIMYSTVTQAMALETEAQQLRRNSRAQLISTGISAAGQTAGGVNRVRLSRQQTNLLRGNPV